MNNNRMLVVSPDTFRAVRQAATRSLLILSEDELFGQAVVDSLTEVGHQAFLAKTSEQAACQLALNPTIEAALLHAVRPSLDHWWLLDGLRQLRPSLSVISCFENPDVQTPLELPTDADLPQNWDLDDLFVLLPPKKPASPRHLPL